MNREPLLTLGLPVYNGEQCIGFTLQSIIDALKYVNDSTKIEILVSDNNSTDKTSEVVNKFINDGFKINYYCNETNIGYDGNIDAIVKRASGKYVWFLGCGEKIKIDALTRLIEKFNNDDIEYTNILLDFDIYDEKEDKITVTNIYSFNHNIIVEGKNNFLHDKYALALSSNIINKIMWNQISNQQLVVNGWAHIERILSIIALKEDSKTLILVHPYFTLFREKHGWWTKPKSSLLSMLLLRLDITESMSQKGFSPSTVNKLKRQQSRMPLIDGIIDSKNQKFKPQRNILYKMINILGKDYFFWFFLLPLYLLPSSLLFIPKSVFILKSIFNKVLQNVKKPIH